eukprot:Pgem_evm1s4507
MNTILCTLHAQKIGRRHFTLIFDHADFDAFQEQFFNEILLKLKNQRLACGQ